MTSHPVNIRKHIISIQNLLTTLSLVRDDIEDFGEDWTCPTELPLYMKSVLLYYFFLINIGRFRHLHNFGINSEIAIESF